MTAIEDAVRARRMLTNTLIAGRQAARLRPFFSVDAAVMVGEGGLYLGAEAILAAFEAQFSTLGFIAYERACQSVEVSNDCARVAEAGTWVGRWLGRPSLSGRHLAAWREARGQWVIEQELYVTLIA